MSDNTKPIEDQLKEQVARMASLSDVLLEHILTFEEKIDEVADSFESRIEEVVNERVTQRLKELGYASV